MSQTSIIQQSHSGVRTAHLSDPYLGINKFFDCESIEEVRERFDSMQETILTESYSDLDRDEKWNLFNFMKRMKMLIESAFVLNYNHQQNMARTDK